MTLMYYDQYLSTYLKNKFNFWRTGKIDDIVKIKQMETMAVRPDRGDENEDNEEEGKDDEEDSKEGESDSQVDNDIEEEDDEEKEDSDEYQDKEVKEIKEKAVERPNNLKDFLNDSEQMGGWCNDSRDYHYSPRPSRVKKISQEMNENIVPEKPLT